MRADSSVGWAWVRLPRLLIIYLRNKRWVTKIHYLHICTCVFVYYNFIHRNYHQPIKYESNMKMHYLQICTRVFVYYNFIHRNYHQPIEYEPNVNPYGYVWKEILKAAYHSQVVVLQRGEFETMISWIWNRCIGPKTSNATIS